MVMMNRSSGVELEVRRDNGTTFLVVIPRCYPIPARAAGYHCNPWEYRHYHTTLGFAARTQRAGDGNLS